MRLRGNKPLWIGLGGSGVTAVCCFTPVLVIGLGAVGAGAAIAWLDVVLLPLLGFFLLLAAYGVVRLVRRPAGAPHC